MENDNLPPIKSASGITLYVKNLQNTVQFYTKLGFNFRKIGDKSATGYINWYWIEFIDAKSTPSERYKKDADATDKGLGLYLNFSVDDVDDFHGAIVDHGYNPASAPLSHDYGRREFVLKDPDGYKLVFFQKLK